MSRKYPSMQDELEARKSAGEYGDLTEYDRRLYHNEPEWAKKSREDYRRSQRISNNGAGKAGWSLPEQAAVSGEWSLRGKQKSRAGKQKPRVDKQRTPKIPKQKADRETVSKQTAQPRTLPNTRATVRPVRPANKKIGCLILALFFIVMPLIGAIIAVVGDIVSDFSNEYNYDFEFVDDWTEEDNGELSAHSTFTDAEDYILEMTGPSDASNEELTSVVYSDDVYELLSDNAFFDLLDGRVIVCAQCSENDDPEEVLSDQLYIIEQISNALADSGYDDVSVAVIVEEAGSYELRLVIIDDMIHFASGDYEELGE